MLIQDPIVPPAQAQQIAGLVKGAELAASLLTYERYTRNWQGGTAGWNWNPQYAPRFNFAKDLPLQNLYAVGHYVFNPGGVPTAMITAWYIAREMVGKEHLC
jgi:phytoene dehydrogenase-like protein